MLRINRKLWLNSFLLTQQLDNIYQHLEPCCSHAANHFSKTLCHVITFSFFLLASSCWLFFFHKTKSAESWKFKDIHLVRFTFIFLSESGPVLLYKMINELQNDPIDFSTTIWSSRLDAEQRLDFGEAVTIWCSFMRFSNCDDLKVKLCCSLKE